MRTVAWVLLRVKSVLFLVQLFQSSHGEFVQLSRKNVACSPDTPPSEPTDGSGWFTSPNYPNNYPDYTNRRWQLTSKKTTVSLDFTDFNTELNTDIVRIYNGNSTAGALLGEFSGRISPPPTGIHSSKPQMLIVFTSNNYYGTTGFNASYWSSDCVFEPDPCNPAVRPMALTDFEGTFQSNGFPVAYANNSNCQWLFSSQLPDGIVRLEFDVFVTEYLYDTAVIYDGSHNTAPRLGSLSGSSTSLQKIFYSSQQYMFVNFYTDSRVSYSGFNGTYRSQVRPTTTAFPPGRCGTNLHVSPSEATIPPTHDIICQLDKVDIRYDQLYCFDLIQNLPGIGNAEELIKQGGNFGCALTSEDSYVDAQNACVDNYQWLTRLGPCNTCTRMYVCIRF